MERIFIQSLAFCNCKSHQAHYAELSSFNEDILNIIYIM